VLPTIVLTATVALVITTVLLLLLGRHLRLSSRLLGLLFAALIAYGSAELATRLWGLVPSYALAGAGVYLLASVVVVFVLPYWNPIGQAFLGAFAAAAGTYLILGAYITVAGTLSLLGVAASAVLLVLELLALLVSGYFAFEGCDALCRARPSRVIPTPDPSYLPKVTLQVPAYNEPADMLIRTIQSLEAIDYPNLDILVVDNNTEDPETWRPVADYCAGRERVRFIHVEVSGFKAGALNLANAQHLDPDVELIGVIDADYLVDPSYLRRVVGYFADPSVAFVQTPQDYRDWQGDSYLTACHDAYDYFFQTSMPSRDQRNSIIFAGTMGLIRRRVLEELGGWPEWCITEDSETSLRMLRAGYQGVYVREAMGWGIMPLTFATLKSQRFRWCFGGIQVLRKHLRDLLPLPRRRGSRLTVAQRTDYLFGTGLVWFIDLLYLGFTGVLLVTAFLVLTGQSLPFRPLYGPLILLPAALVASGLLRALWSLRHRTGIGMGRALLALFNWLSLSWTVATASMQGLIRSKAVFMRTPKERDRQTLWTALRDARVESALALLLWGSGIAIAVSGAGPLFLVGLFAWQGMVYASAPLMSYLNVRTVLTPELERRRRTELRRERAAALAPYYLGGTAATAAAAVVGAILFFGGSDPGQPPGGLELPRQPGEPGILTPPGDAPATTGPASPGPSGTDSEPGTDPDPGTEPTGSPEPEPTDAPPATEEPTGEPTTPESSPTGSG
jgi:cellulose synthase/poly-beta-1,6-N-acetylglucosamine synthase-like glycosyltransferase